MVVVQISYTHRTPHPSSEWTIFHEERRQFPTIAAAHENIDEQYTYVKKRVPVYQDRVGMKPMQTGWIYCYKEQEDGKTWYRQDWVIYGRLDFRAIDVRDKDIRDYNHPPVKES